MASIQEIQDKLSIIVGDREINPGMCKPMKNRYYNINDEFLVVEFKDNNHMVFTNDAKTRELFSNRVWYIGFNEYANNRAVGYFHQNYLDYEQGLVCDHKNLLRYDNRQTNLRVVTYTQNSRNHTKRKDNTSGKNGVTFHIGMQSWVAEIYGNDGRKRKSFSTTRYGAEEAKRLAIEQRLAWEIEFGYEGQ